MVRRRGLEPLRTTSNKLKSRRKTKSILVAGLLLEVLSDSSYAELRYWREGTLRRRVPGHAIGSQLPAQTTERFATGTSGASCTRSHALPLRLTASVVLPSRHSPRGRATRYSPSANRAAHQRVFTHTIVPDFDDFTVVSDGIGYISLIGAVPALDIDRQSLVVNGGLSFPAGSITEKAATPALGTSDLRLETSALDPIDPPLCDRVMHIDTGWAASAQNQRCFGRRARRCSKSAFCCGAAASSSSMTAG